MQQSTITADQVVPLIVSACPSFRNAYEACSNKDLPYVIMGDLARHLLVLHQRSETTEFQPLCEVIERLHIAGVHSVRELATIGILEGIQNVWANNGVDPEMFGNYLLPESKRSWNQLNDFWQGKSYNADP